MKRLLLAALSIGLSAGMAQQDLSQPDAQRTRQDLSALLERYPPQVRGVLALDPSLDGNEPWLATYPALGRFLTTHPDVARNPGFYIGAPMDRFNQVRDNSVSREIVNDLSIFASFGMAIGLLIWLIRTVVDYRRWSRLAKVQTDAHAKLLDRFTSNEDLLAYIQSPAGAKFLESSPIALDAAPRSIGAPLGRILWSVQGGVVLLAAGMGLFLIRVHGDAEVGFRALGTLGIALGLGFVASAVISFAISRRLGLVDVR